MRHNAAKAAGFFRAAGDTLGSRPGSCSMVVRDGAGHEFDPSGANTSEGGVHWWDGRQGPMGLALSSGSRADFRMYRRRCGLVIQAQVLLALDSYWSGLWEDAAERADEVVELCQIHGFPLFAISAPPTMGAPLRPDRRAPTRHPRKPSRGVIGPRSWPIILLPTPCGVIGRALALGPAPRSGGCKWGRQVVAPADD